MGANAVNGVINIITKSARDTQSLISVTAGNPKNTIVGLRYSGQLGRCAHYRLYGKFLDQDGLLDAQGQDAEDDWRLGSGGFDSIGRHRIGIASPCMAVFSTSRCNRIFSCLP